MSGVRPSQHPPKGAVVQLVRIPACHAGGRGFESRPLRQLLQAVTPQYAPATPEFCAVTVSERKFFDRNLGRPLGAQHLARRIFTAMNSNLAHGSNGDNLTPVC